MERKFKWRWKVISWISTNRTNRFSPKLINKTTTENVGNSMHQLWCISPKSCGFQQTDSSFLARSQLSTIIHLPFHCTVHVCIVIDCCGSMWSFAWKQFCITIWQMLLNKTYIMERKFKWRWKVISWISTNRTNRFSPKLFHSMIYCYFMCNIWLQEDH
jgi:hypothetical protein